EQDWNLIIDKINEGKAEELSDSLTKYLGATTKGSKTEKNMTTQPFSDEKAHKRSITLKGSYMTELARKIMSGKYKEPSEYLIHEDKSIVAEPALDYQSPEPIIKDIEQLKFKTFEEIIIEQFEPFIHMSKKELGNNFNVKISKKNDKDSTPKLAKKILNFNTDIENRDEFLNDDKSIQMVHNKYMHYKKISNKINVNEKSYEYRKAVNSVKTTTI